MTRHARAAVVINSQVMLFHVMLVDQAAAGDKWSADKNPVCSMFVA